MTLPEKCCGTCGWGIPSMLFPPNGIQCTVEIPDSITNPVPRVMYLMWGMKCKCWKPKEGK